MNNLNKYQKEIEDLHIKRNKLIRKLSNRPSKGNIKVNEEIDNLGKMIRSKMKKKFQ